MAVLPNRGTPLSPGYYHTRAAHQRDWLVFNTADSSPASMSNTIMPEEMLEDLQTEMDSIKADQQALKDEINSIKAQFFNLVNSCAFDDSNISLTTSLVVPEMCNSPQQIRVRAATPGRDPSPVKGGCSYGDKLIQMMLEMPSSYLEDTDISESPPKQSQCQARHDAEGGDQSGENDNFSGQCQRSEPGNGDINVPSMVTVKHKPLEPIRLNFDSCHESDNSCDKKLTRVGSEADILKYAQERPMHDSVRFNPDSVLNSTSICVFDESKSMLNCTSAAGDSPEAYVSRLSSGCASSFINPGLINPASVLNCTAEHGNHTRNSSIPFINPAHVLDSSSLRENQSSLITRAPSYSQYSTSIQVIPEESESFQENFSTDFPRTERFLVGCTSAEAHPISTTRAPLLDEPPSMISYTAGMYEQSMPLAPEPYPTPTPMIEPPKYHSTNLSSRHVTTLNTNQTNKSRQVNLNNPRPKVTGNSLNITPAVNASYAVHSTPAIFNGNGRSSEHFLNPTCSAIVDYSVSSSESSDSSVSRGPRSSTGDLSDTQPVLDRQQEMESRQKYYSDFTIDRQRKINKMRNRLDLTPCVEYESSSQDDVPNDTMCRFVEGAEDQPHQVCLIGPPYSRTSSLGSSSSGGSSTLQKTAVSISRNSNSPSPCQGHSTGRVLKSTENTRHLTPVNVSEGRQRRSSSTTSGHSTSPSSSAYAWSLKSSSREDNQESSHHRHKKSRGDKRTRSSKRRSSHHSTEDKHTYCRDHDVHTMLGQPCHQVMKYIPIQAYYPKDLILSNDSLYDDGYKSQTLPRSSTKKSFNPTSRNSSLEAKRNSVPDICALKSPQNSAIISSGSDSLSSKHSAGRRACLGMSSSGSQDSPTDSSGPSKDRRGSSVENNENTALTDSILTDSPKSVSSSGIFAPCNSPDATTGSRISCSTIADSQFMDLRGISVIQPNATAISGISAITSSSILSEFKVPKAPAPRRSSRRKGNRCSTPDVRTSTPKPNSYPNSVQSEKVSCRKLFSSSSSTYSSHATKTSYSSTGSSSSRLLDKRSVIKKFRKFSENFYKTKSGSKIQIETLANL